MKTIRSIEDLLAAYANGTRRFVDGEFDAFSFQGLSLPGIIFEGCFAGCDFKKANLERAQFIRCNIKTADFAGANLRHAIITGCFVESMRMKGAQAKHLVFEENYYMGHTMGQEDLRWFLEN